MSMIGKKGLHLFSMVLMSVCLLFGVTLTANAASGDLTLIKWDDNWDSVEMDLSAGDTYAGLTYDEAAHTLTMNNATLDKCRMFYDGASDLTIVLKGKSTWESGGGRAFFINEGAWQSDITIKGSGSLNVNTENSCFIYQSYDPNGECQDNGNIIIDGATIYCSGSGIMSNHSDVIIKNDAEFTVDGSANTSTYGIVTGRTGYGANNRGCLTINNSNVIIKNCGTTLAYNELKSSGVTFYSGSMDAPENEINPDQEAEKQYAGTIDGVTQYRKLLYDYPYFCATTSDIVLPEEPTEPETPAESEDAYAYLEKVQYVYNSKKIRRPEVYVYDSNTYEYLEEGVDYDVKYQAGRKNVGRYKVTITLKGDYSGTKELYFDIVPQAPKNVKVSVYKKYNQVKLSWDKSVGAETYCILYKKTTDQYFNELKNTSKCYTIISNLDAGATYQFCIVPQFNVWDEEYDMEYEVGDSESSKVKVTILKKVSKPTISKSGSKVKVSWKNISGESGYQISKSTKKTGTNIVATYKTTTGKYKKLTATRGKTYYYKVRAYKVVNGKKIYGPWSEAVAYKRK